jgi:hypothetical protein
MYEIWLMLNIVFETALTIQVELAIAALVLLILWLIARNQLASDQLKPTVGLGLAFSCLLFLIIPSLTKSSLSEMGYWVDWVNLVSLALGFGVVGMFYIFPVMCIARKQYKA